MGERGTLLLALALGACSGEGVTAPAAPCLDAAGQRAKVAALALSLGEVLELCDPAAMAEIRLASGSSTHEYLAVVVNAGAIADQLGSFRISWVPPATPAASTGRSAERLATDVQPVGGEFATDSPEGVIREYEASLPGPADAARLWAGVRDRTPAEPRPRLGIGGTAALVMGDQVSVRVPRAHSANLCYDFRTVTSRVRAVGEHVVILEDLEAPAGGFSETDFADLAAEFESLHAEVIRRYFGALSDIDDDGRVHLLVTPEVNRLSPAGSTSFVTGYFFGGDLLPRFSGELWPVCLQSNEAEILYVLAPDPNGTIGGVRRPVDEVRQQLRGTIVHELQHMVNFGERMRLGAEPEAGWLNEALSHFAEELAGRRRRGLGDFQELTSAELIDPRSGLRDYQAYFVQNLLRFRAWTARPDTTSPTSAAARLQLAPRGAGWALVRYAADHHAADDLAAFLRRLVAGPRSGTINLSEATGIPFETLVSGWMVANFADDLPFPVPEQRHGYRSWRMRSTIAETTGGVPAPGNPYPLRVVRLTAAAGSDALAPPSGSGGYYVITHSSGEGDGLLSLLSAHGAPVALPGARLLVMRLR